MRKSEFDLVVYGATGFTGQLVAEYIQHHYGLFQNIRWALAGRNLAKLQTVRQALGMPDDFPLVTVTAEDPISIASMVQRTRVCLSTVGPYQLYGTNLVAACAQAGVDYVDLSGETVWMRAMIDAYAEQARRSGARIVFSSGFDSIPSELGVFALQAFARETTGSPIQRIHCHILQMRGGISGGTLASMRVSMAAAEDLQVAAAFAILSTLLPISGGQASRPVMSRPSTLKLECGWRPS